MADLIFYSNPMSRARIARWVLEEVGAPYETVLLDYGTTMKSPEYLAVNPMGKVPAIKHGDVVVTEGAAICAYLADAFPEAQLAPPPGDRRRGTYYRWLFFGAGPVEQAATSKSMGLLAPIEKRAMAGYGTYDDVMDTLEKAVAGGPYLCGDQFTAADVYLGSQIGWGLNFGTIDKRPGFAEYFARISSRPAAVRANQLDEDAMAHVQRPPMPPQPAS